jgi:predicted aspartyl protease
MIIVRVQIHGPRGIRDGRFALDTGAEVTRIPPQLAAAVGLEPVPSGRIMTASELVNVESVQLSSIVALGVTKRDLMVRVHPLPPGARMVGLLGVDFFRDTRLTIDFGARRVAVA